MNISPGPFVVAQPARDPNAFDIVNAKGGTIAKLVWGRYSRPDAHLLAASFELREALRALVERCEASNVRINEVKQGRLVLDQLDRRIG